MIYIFSQYLITLGWAITGAISMGIALGILTKIFSMISPVDDWAEIKNNNLSMAVVLSSVIIGGAIVIGLTIIP